MEQINTLTDWNFSFKTLEDSKFWEKYVLLKKGDDFKYLEKKQKKGDNTRYRSQPPYGMATPHSVTGYITTHLATGLQNESIQEKLFGLDSNY